MKKITFPSEVFPDFPIIEIQIEEDWESINSPQTIIGVIKKKESNFSPNVTIHLYRNNQAVNFETTKNEAYQYFKNLSGLTIFNEIEKEINRNQWQIIEFAYVHPEIGSVVQIIATTFVENGGVQDLIRLTGTASANSKSSDYQEIQEILRTVSIKKKD